MEKLRYDFKIPMKKCFWDTEIGTKFHILNKFGEYYKIKMGFEYNSELMKTAVVVGGK